MRCTHLLAAALLLSACTTTPKPEATGKELVGPISGTWSNRTGDARLTIAPDAGAGFTVESLNLYVHITKRGYETKIAPVLIPGDAPTDWTPGDKRDWSQILTVYSRYLDDTQRTLSQTQELLKSFDQPEVQALVPSLAAMAKALSSNQSERVTAASRQIARALDPSSARHVSSLHAKTTAAGDDPAPISDFD